MGVELLRLRAGHVWAGFTEVGVDPLVAKVAAPWCLHRAEPAAARSQAASVPQLEADASNRIPLDVSTAPDTSNWHQLDVIPAPPVARGRK